MVQISSNEKRLNCIIVGISIVIVLINLMLASSKTTLLGLSALLAFLVILFFYYFNFISVFLDEKNHIVLKKAGKEIEYLRINKIILLPIANRQLAGYYSIFALRYTNAKNKMATKFISVSPSNATLISNLKESIRNSNAKLPVVD